MTKFLFLFVTSALLTVSPFMSTAQKKAAPATQSSAVSASEIGRWKVKDMTVVSVGRGHMNAEQQKQTTDEIRSQQLEYEFKADKNFTVYSKGSVIASGTYTRKGEMLELVDGKQKTTEKIKIIKLKAGILDLQQSVGNDYSTIHLVK